MPEVRELRDASRPAALACALLEDNGRAFFLIRRDQSGRESYGLPCALVPPGGDPMSTAIAALKAQAGIDAYSKGAGFEAKHNAGSRKHKHAVPVLVFRMDAKAKSARPSAEFSGFKWLPLEEAKRMRLARNSEWLRTIT